MTDSIGFMDNRDPERGRVVTTIIKTGTEEWAEFVGEGAAGEGVDNICGIDVVKGDQTLQIIHKHSHRLRPWFH